MKKIVSVILAVSMGLMACGGSSEKAADSVEKKAEETKNAEENKDTIVWSFYSAYGPEDGACCEIWPGLFDEIYEKTEGRLKIETFWYGTHPYEGEDMLKVVFDGTAEIAQFYSGYAEAVEPALAVEGLPLLLPVDGMEAYKILSALWGNFEQDKSGTLEAILEEKWNATLVHCMPASPQRLFTMGYEATDADSLKGHKIRSYSTATAAFVQALGGTPVSLSLSDVYTSLSTNLVDGLITSTLFGYNYGVFDFIDNLNCWEISSSTDALMVNMDALAELPDDVRDVFLQVMRDSATKPEMLEIDKNDALLDELKEKGVNIVYPSDEYRNEIRNQMQESVWAEWLESAGEDGKKVLDQLNSMM
ncbi:MAG: TRAP transporter substrate-binding protein DctP [Eubacteriales bacterium]|nr:TRAP transporter substrate-binding protein DctP [Eubacteriales bacterium]